MYSVPLRRALVAQSSLPYPEGVAAAEVLKVGTARGHVGESAIAPACWRWSRERSPRPALPSIVATRIFAGAVAGYFRVGSATTGLGFSLSLALVGAGQLIGICGRPGDPRRARHRVGHRDAAAHRAASRGRRGRRRRDGGLVASSALHRRGRDRRRGALVARAARAARRGRRRLGAGSVAAPARGLAARTSPEPSATCRSGSSALISLLLLDSARRALAGRSCRRPAGAARRLR